MASESKKVKDFQIDFLKFLSDKTISEVHIYHYIMNYWSNDSSVVSLQVLKDAVTDLCNRNLIVSKNNAHVTLGVLGVPEEDQKNNAICIILDKGKKYLRRITLFKKFKNGVLLLLLLAVIYYIWHHRKFIVYFFR